MDFPKILCQSHFGDVGSMNLGSRLKKHAAAVSISDASIFHVQSAVQAWSRVNFRRFARMKKIRGLHGMVIIP